MAKGSSETTGAAPKQARARNAGGGSAGGGRRGAAQQHNTPQAQALPGNGQIHQTSGPQAGNQPLMGQGNQPTGEGNQFAFDPNTPAGQAFMKMWQTSCRIGQALINRGLAPIGTPPDATADVIGVAVVGKRIDGLESEFGLTSAPTATAELVA